MGDGRAAELLHEELALRGFTVLHDRCTFTVGTRLDAAMATAVERCDAYVPLTPHSLYEGKPAGAPRPALDGELVPVGHRRRASLAHGDSPPLPVIAVVTHGLGDPRAEAPERVRRATGEDIASMWSRAVPQTGETLRQVDAALVVAVGAQPRRVDLPRPRHCPGGSGSGRRRDPRHTRRPLIVDIDLVGHHIGETIHRRPSAASYVLCAMWRSRSGGRS